MSKPTIIRYVFAIAITICSIELARAEFTRPGISHTQLRDGRELESRQRRRSSLAKLLFSGQANSKEVSKQR